MTTVVWLLTALVPAAIHADYKSMPSTDKIFSWVVDLWRFGDEGRYGFRMPGTQADHKAIDYLYKKFLSFGLRACRRTSFLAVIRSSSRMIDGCFYLSGIAA